MLMTLSMPPLTPLTIKRLQELEAAVLAQVRSDDPRVNELMTSLMRHAHAFVQEARPTHDEWATAVDFLIRVGQACTAQRNELILLMDMLGLTSAVDDVNFPGIPGATPSSVEGPFHASAPPRSNGDWISGGPERGRGETMVVRGTVTGVAGDPIAAATVDIWQADDAGHYDSQDPRQALGNLRGLFTTDAHGGFWFRSVLPSSYPVPTDGPAGELLRALGRHPMRPGHIHLRVAASGFRPVTTHVFVAGDPYLGSDAAFAVKEELVVDPVIVTDAPAAAAYGVSAPCRVFEFSIRLVEERPATIRTPIAASTDRP
jgi:catechol 1,2-dioxygenase